MGKKIYTYIKNNSIVNLFTTLITILITVVVLSINHISIDGVFDSFNISILVSFIIVMIARIISAIIKYAVESQYEDIGKLETDYDKICKGRYEGKLKLVNSSVFKA